MRRGPSVANALPLFVASSGCASWVDVLNTYHKTCELLSGIYKPTTEELNKGLASMETSWGVSLFYYDIVKGICGCAKPHTRLVSTAVERFKRCGNFYAIKRIMEEDVDITTSEGARSALTYASFTGMWEHAMSIYNCNKRMQSNMADTRILVNLLSANGRWNEALQLIYRQSPPLLNPVLIKPVVRALGVAGEYKKMLQLVAASLAQGHEINESLFSALVRPLQKGSQWKAALDTAMDLGLFSSSRELNHNHISTLGGIVDCLYSVDPYSKLTLREIVDDMSYRMYPRKIILRSSQKTDKSFRLVPTAELFRGYQRYLTPLSSIYSRILSLNNVHYRPVSVIADEALKRGDTLLILDTNFLLQCVAKNLPLSHFYPPMRKQYPHLENDSLYHIIIPFTTVREIHKLIWNPSSQLKRAVRSLLWSRVTSFLKQPSVTVLALSSEFPCTSFSVISRLAYSRLNEPANESDPDLRILNTCLALQYTFRQRTATALQGGPQMAEGTVLFSFMKYHIRRHRRDVRGIASNKMLLCTLDKRLSAAADELGIQTFPQYNLSVETPYKTK
ncbi:PIN domain [Trypanosoma melophagium]|uniref:PIN domain n=1 Tax=Trypanosoma melophagium TaxID=715481 RepID=UPI003519EF89|nr:PIN domain [Trypanosoma melophagium]